MGRIVTAAQGAVSWLPVVTPTPVSSTRPGVVTGWNGPESSTTRSTTAPRSSRPTKGCAQPNGHGLELINDVAATYSTSETRQTVFASCWSAALTPNDTDVELLPNVAEGSSREFGPPKGWSELR